MNNKCEKCGAENLNNAKYCHECGCELPKPTIEDVPQTKTMPVKEKNNKIPIATIIGTIVGIIVATFITFRTPSFDKELMKIANEMNKSCPMMMDSETQLDNVVVLPPKALQYNYTLINMAQESIDTVEMRGYLEPNIINIVRTDPQMQFFRDNKITINYHYRDKMGNYVLTISVIPKQYE